MDACDVLYSSQKGRSHEKRPNSMSKRVVKKFKRPRILKLLCGRVDWYENIHAWIIHTTDKKVKVNCAPRKEESMAIIEMFEQYLAKPVLHIGHVCLSTKEDRQGLWNLKKEGFQLENWMRASDRIRHNYRDHLTGYINQLPYHVSQ